MEQVDDDIQFMYRIPKRMQTPVITENHVQGGQINLAMEIQQTPVQSCLDRMDSVSRNMSDLSALVTKRKKLNYQAHLLTLPSLWKQALGDQNWTQ